MEALARRTGDENRLTELLACVLARDDEFAHEMLLRADLHSHRVLDVRTQVATGEGLCTMDMCLKLEALEGGHAELWSEHKLWSPFGRGQLENYKRALENKRARGESIRFQVIVDASPAPADQDLLSRMDARVVTWPELADAIEKVQSGRATGWYEAARKPGASAQLRVLAELAAYLEEHVGVAVSGPLDSQKLSALENIQAARDVSQALLERLAQRLAPDAEFGYDPGKPEEKWLWIDSTGWWKQFSGGTLYLWVAPVRFFEEDADPVPSFGVSVEVAEPGKEVLLGDEALHAAIKAAGLRVSPYDGNGPLHIGDSAELASVADRASLNDQAAALEPFARETILRLGQCIPTAHDAKKTTEPVSMGALDPERLMEQSLQWSQDSGSAR